MKYPAGYERMWNVTTIFVVDKADFFDIFSTLSYSTISSSTAIKRMHGARREGICMPHGAGHACFYVAGVDVMLVLVSGDNLLCAWFIRLSGCF